jgi:hypothetical protein
MALQQEEEDLNDAAVDDWGVESGSIDDGVGGRTENAGESQLWRLAQLYKAD